ncbi:hypothetical protein [Pseudomonas batumici]|uniref:Uncharacterized protein n=1 Tax=Pseudomonas batumici TaxID=226910 RepID=A0A0C2EVJ2_9PSED|nr:hypothetical protein [Pseudomonas batumici]KIH82668.1 hypothetical protein UCMB321_3445 [Pseudomonas batumici]
MNTPFFSRFKGWGVWAPIAVALLVILIAAAFNLGGVYVMQGLPAWQAWRAHTYWYFFAWRMGLYSVALLGWLKYRARLLKRKPGANLRWRKAEIAVVLALVLMEMSRAYTQLGG